jgi:hypothetical protein
MVTIIDAIQDKNLFRPLFKDLRTWAAWVVFLKALFGLALHKRELPLYRQATGRETPPKVPFGEAWAVCGRRSGKSFIAALTAVFLACFKNWRPHLAPGERAVILVLAADRVQARIVLNYVKGFLGANPMMGRLIETDRTESIDLSNRVTIQVGTCSYKTTRGPTLAACIADEVAFWRSDDGANPASEVLRAIRPGLATLPGSLLLCISSPFAQAGPVWDTFKAHHGQDDSPVLVWQADTRTMNPTIGQYIIDRDMQLDPEAARSEWMAEFRSDLSTFLDWTALEAVIVPGRFELLPQKGIRYFAFADPSGGRVDAAALAISHAEGDRVILDVARRWPAPHSPQVVVAEMSEILKAYNVRRIIGDKFGGSWPGDEFQKHGITYEAAAKPKSDLYLHIQPVILSGRCELLDLKVLMAELRNLMRRARSGGKDLVDHPPRGSDDLANAAAGAITQAAAATSRATPRIRWL